LKFSYIDSRRDRKIGMIKKALKEFSILLLRSVAPEVLIKAYQHLTEVPTSSTISVPPSAENSVSSHHQQQVHQNNGEHIGIYHQFDGNELPPQQEPHDPNNFFQVDLDDDDSES
jgi:hypothetical protein